MMITPTAAACPPAEWVVWICRIAESAHRDCHKPAAPLLQKVAPPRQLGRDSLKKPRFARGFFLRAHVGGRSSSVGVPGAAHSRYVLPERMPAERRWRPGER